MYTHVHPRASEVTQTDMVKMAGITTTRATLNTERSIDHLGQYVAPYSKYIEGEYSHTHICVSVYVSAAPPPTNGGECPIP